MRSQLSRLSILPVFNVIASGVIIALSSLPAYCLHYCFHSRRNNVYSRKGENESYKSSFKNSGRPREICFQGEEFWAEEKKNISWLSATSPVPNSSTPLVTEKETFHKLNSRREADTGIALWQILQLQNMQLVPHHVGHDFWISVVTYLPKSPITVSLRLVILYSSNPMSLNWEHIILEK